MDSQAGGETPAPCEESRVKNEGVEALASQ